MPSYPIVEASSRSLEQTGAFLGYDHNLRINDGEWYDMANLTTDHYPVAATRKERGIVEATLTSPQGLLAKTALAWVDGAYLYYGGRRVEGITLSTAAAKQPKTLLSMGAYLLIWPDKVYYNTENASDYGYLEAENSLTLSAGSALSICICTQEGSGITPDYVQASAPEDPEAGEYWLDTSGNTYALKIWSEASSMWVEQATTYVKLAAAGIGAGLQQWDGVSISGLAAPAGATEAERSQVEALNGTVVLYGADTDYIIVIGLVDTALSLTSGTVRVAREVPDMDFITEAENRLWGCKYGYVNGQTVNEIFGCALGDFKNWNRFLGISTDSWYGSVGTDGQWTGAATLLGHPVFFKETCLHKLYISAGGAHQLVSAPCRGVQRGSEKSLQVVGEVLYYKGKTGVYRYDGSTPEPVSAALGTEMYYEGTAGVWGDKYYLAMRDEAENWSLFCYDTGKGLWTREDGAKPLCFAATSEDLFYIDRDDKTLRAVNGRQGTAEGAFDWYGVTGILGFEDANRKYLSRFNLRLDLEDGARADLYLQYDSDGRWIHRGHMEAQGLQTFLLPVRPRRCDHLQIKLEGRGGARLYSITREYQRGSDGQWGA